MADNKEIQKRGELSAAKKAAKERLARASGARLMEVLQQRLHEVATRWADNGPGPAVVEELGGKVDAAVKVMYDDFPLEQVLASHKSRAALITERLKGHAWFLTKCQEAITNLQMGLGVYIQFKEALITYCKEQENKDGQGTDTNTPSKGSSGN